MAEDDASRTANAYGKRLARLRQIKAAYDPDNLFRMNRNILPAAGVTAVASRTDSLRR